MDVASLATASGDGHSGQVVDGDGRGDLAGREAVGGDVDDVEVSDHPVDARPSSATGEVLGDQAQRTSGAPVLRARHR